MSEQRTQTKDNHTRFHAPFHFFFLPAIMFLVAVAVYGVVHAPGLFSAAQLVLVLVVGVAGFLARTYALKVQDRVIRLEERLRLATLAPGTHLPARSELSEQQLIALRFASDEELPALAHRAGAEGLDGKAIKALIKKWRPDYWRV